MQPTCPLNSRFPCLFQAVTQLSCKLQHLSSLYPRLTRVDEAAADEATDILSFISVERRTALKFDHHPISYIQNNALNNLYKKFPYSWFSSLPMAILGTPPPQLHPYIQGYKQRIVAEISILIICFSFLPTTFSMPHPPFPWCPFCVFFCLYLGHKVASVSSRLSRLQQ